MLGECDRGRRALTQINWKGRSFLAKGRPNEDGGCRLLTQLGPANRAACRVSSALFQRRRDPGSMRSIASRGATCSRYRMRRRSRSRSRACRSRAMPYSPKPGSISPSTATRRSASPTPARIASNVADHAAPEPGDRQAARTSSATHQSVTRTGPQSCSAGTE